MDRSKESSSCTLPVIRGRTPLQNCVVTQSFETINLLKFKIISVTFYDFLCYNNMFPLCATVLLAYPYVHKKTVQLTGQVFNSQYFKVIAFRF